MPTPLSRRDLRRQQEFENEQTQQATDQRAQAGMLQMLQSLYGIGQEQQFAPARLKSLESETKARDYQTAFGEPARTAATVASTEAQRIQNARLPEALQSQLETAAQARRLAEAQDTRAGALHPLQLKHSEFENQVLGLRMPYIQPTAQAEIDQTKAQTKEAGARAGALADHSNELTPRDVLQYQLHTGQPIPKELRRFAPQEYQDIFTQQDATANAQRWASMEDEARKGNLDQSNAELQFGPANVEYLKTLRPTGGQMPPGQETNLSYLAKALSPVPAINSSNQVFAPFYSALPAIYDWLKQPHK